MTPEEQKQQREEKQRKLAEQKQYSDYKKRLRDNVEIKRLQVEELELNTRFYMAKEAWLEMQKRIPEIEAKEAKHIAEEEEKAKKQREEMIKAMEEKKKAAEKEAKKNQKQEKQEKPDILIAKQGKAREK